MTPNEDMDDVTRAYRNARAATNADDGPPAALDDAIRAAARRAVHSRPQPAGQGWITRWRTPLSAAAVMVLAVSVVFVGMDERSDVAPASLQQAKQDLRQAIPIAPPVAGADIGIAGALQDQATPKAEAAPPKQSAIVSEARIAAAREKKQPGAAGNIAADAERRSDDSLRDRMTVMAKEKSNAANADPSAGRRDIAAAPPPPQAAALGAVAAAAPVIVPAPAAPAVPVAAAPVIAFAPPPPAAAGASAPARAMASAPASVSAPVPAPASAAAPVVSNTSPVIAADRAKLAEALARQSRQEPAKPAEAAEARYTGAARHFAKAEAARDAQPPPAAVTPQATAAAKAPTEKITVTGSVVAPPVYAPAAPPVKSLVEQKESADAWIKRIEQLLKDNKLKDVREELARFRKAYPNATLPPALAQLPAE